MYRLRRVSRALLIFVVFIAFVVSVFVTIRVASDIAWKRAGRQPWAEGLGTLEQVEARYPLHQDSQAAEHLAELAKPLGVLLADSDDEEAAHEDSIQEYLGAQYASPRPAIDAPPAKLVAYLEHHERELDAIRERLLMRGGAIEWHEDLTDGLESSRPNLWGHLELARIFADRALVRAREDDARAWDDLHAIVELRKTLLSRPEPEAQNYALTIAKIVNTTAWKCPLPVPRWFQDLDLDQRAEILASLRNHVWWIWKTLPHVFGTNYANHQRETARQLAAVTACGFDAEEFLERRTVDLPLWNIAASFTVKDPPWGQLMRFVVEREATTNALRVRGGQPIVEHSQCSDGSWSYANGTLAFSIELPKQAKGNVMPLKLVEVVADAGH